MGKEKEKNQFPDAVSRDLDGGFIVTLPYGGAFVPQKDKAYMCVGTEQKGQKPIFRIQGIALKGNSGMYTTETVKSPVVVSKYLKDHENLTRELGGFGEKPAPILRRGEWYYYSHENPDTGVNEISAMSLGHLGVLDVRCMKNDIFFVLDNTTVAEE